jgi:hypothetical protein
MMHTISTETTIMKSPELIASTLDQETVILSISSSKYFGIDPIGSRIWSCLDQPINVAAIIDLLVEEYNVSKDECQKDVNEFLNLLLKENLIVLC